MKRKLGSVYRSSARRSSARAWPPSRRWPSTRARGRARHAARDLQPSGRPSRPGPQRATEAASAKLRPRPQPAPDLAATAIEAIDLEGLPDLDLTQALTVLASVPSLRRLEIATFRRALPRLDRFTHLTALGLTGLLLGDLPEEILGFRDLEALSLGRNQLTSLPDALFRLPRLKTLSLHGNPLDAGYLATLRAKHPQLTIFG